MSPPGSFKRVLSDTFCDVPDTKDGRASIHLWRLAGQCTGMSGRSLRRLPVLAHARHIGTTSISTGSKASNVETWLSAMARIVTEESKGRTFEVKKESI